MPIVYLDNIKVNTPLPTDWKYRVTTRAQLRSTLSLPNNYPYLGQLAVVVDDGENNGLYLLKKEPIYTLPYTGIELTDWEMLNIKTYTKISSEPDPVLGPQHKGAFMYNVDSSVLSVWNGASWDILISGTSGSNFTEYDKATDFPTTGLTGILYVALHDAGDNDLNAMYRWDVVDGVYEQMGGTGSGGSSGVMEVQSFTDLMAPGELSTIYVVRDTNGMYRWSGTEFIYTAGGIGTDIVASVDVGGIKKQVSVDSGTTLEAFINKLINPEIPTKLVSPFLSYSVSTNLSSVEMIGSTYTIHYTPNYQPGKISGYNLTGTPITVDQKGAATYINSPVEGTSYVVGESNSFSSIASYDAGTANVFSSTGELDTSTDRTFGAFPAKYANVTGYYKVFMGVTNKTRSQVVADLNNGIIPTEHHVYSYTLGQNFLKGGDKLAKDNVSLFLLLPKGKFTKSRLVTISNDVPIQTYDLANFGGVETEDVMLPHGDISLTYTLYFRGSFGGWTSDMEIKEFKINNL
ncbi:MAG: hypothetical protein KAH32_03825 [Chlamydiia bacterium]|nr:hypothetical protein [Chlamydiia bacterium]